GNEREKAHQMRVAEAFLRRLDQGSDFYYAAAYFSTVSPVSDGKNQFFGHRGLTRKDAAEFYGSDTITYLFETMKEDDISPIRDEGRTLYVFKLIQKVNQTAETFDDVQGASLVADRADVVLFHRLEEIRDGVGT